MASCPSPPLCLGQPRWSSHGSLRLYSHRERKKKPFGGQADNGEEKLPNALQAAGVSTLAFAAGGVLRLSADGFIGLHWVRMGVVLAVSSLVLAGSRVAGQLSVVRRWPNQQL
ncbi:hypothetical protein EJ110_NYTH16585 [Nymphaea thermarum]|nr:hypothetical protein EJ110_NYTH16585 [Nymphaea thermarum]